MIRDRQHGRAGQNSCAVYMVPSHSGCPTGIRSMIALFKNRCAGYGIILSKGFVLQLRGTSEAARASPLTVKTISDKSRCLKPRRGITITITYHSYTSVLVYSIYASYEPSRGSMTSLYLMTVSMTPDTGQYKYSQTNYSAHMTSFPGVLRISPLVLPLEAVSFGTMSSTCPANHPLFLCSG